MNAARHQTPATSRKVNRFDGQGPPWCYKINLSYYYINYSLNLERQLIIVYCHI